MKTKPAYIKKISKTIRHYRDPLIPDNSGESDPEVSKLLEKQEFVDKKEVDYRYYANKKLKICGNIIEYREYEKNFGVGSRIKTNFVKSDYLNEKPRLTEEEIKEASSRRARNKLIDHINCNAFAWKDESGRLYRPVFLTLTFAHNLIDVTAANYEFTKFVRRLNYLAWGKKSSELKYVAVIEFQKRGAVHFHIIIFNLPYIDRIIDEIKKIWPHIFHVEAVASAQNTGRYISKYIYKGFGCSKLEKGQKLYFASRDLLKPIITYYDELILPVVKQLPVFAIEKQGQNIPIHYLGSMDYTRYNLKEYPLIRKNVLAFLAGNV
ncbi:MAG: hypothetical protein NTW66_04500 [Candidatus Magasanikbacteria bacterium]|nr:hypothetical protein [Candidatus Magasanikbacteria bacterium]